VKKLEDANESIVEVDTATLERLLCMICAKRKALVGLKYELIGWSKLYPKFQKTKRNLIRTSYLVVSLNINDSVDLNQQMTKSKP
jgi:hypothetical protein